MRLCSYVILLALICSAKLSTAQQRCASALAEEALVSAVPTLLEQQALLNARIANYAVMSGLHNRNKVTIPVVVHIVYNDAIENISDEQILSQLEALNADFALEKMNPACPQEFSVHAAAADITFCLASKDPQGAPTNGITRQYTTVKEIGLRRDQLGRKMIHYSRSGGADSWDSKRYVNIWVCNLPEYLGFATRPGMAAYPEEDGIVIDYRSFGTMGTVVSPHNLGRTTVHEMGHYLGLLHIWGPKVGDCGSDLVDDTPPQSGPYYHCPVYPSSSCDHHNMTMNFMDYTDDRCMYMFTAGQRNVMRGVLSRERKELTMDPNTECYDGIEKKLKENLAIYPNVIRDKIEVYISSPGNQVLDFLLFTAEGKLAQEWNTVQSEYLQLDLRSDLVPGIYLLKVRTPNDKSTFKIIIIK